MAQAGIIEHFGLVSVFIGLAIALSMMYIVFFNGSIRFVQKFEWGIIAACFAIPLPITATMFIYTEDGEHIYGDADFWCWITSKHGTSQFAFLFVIQWAVFAFQILAFVLTWIGLRRVENDLARSATTPTATGKSTGSNKKYNKLMSKRMMAYTLAFIICRTPSTANRLYPLITGKPLFELSLLQAVFSPLTGFIDCLVFLYIRYIMERGRRDSSGMGSSSEMTSTFSPKSATNSFAMSPISPRPSSPTPPVPTLPPNAVQPTQRPPKHSDRQEDSRRPSQAQSPQPQYQFSNPMHQTPAQGHQFFVPPQAQQAQPAPWEMRFDVETPRHEEHEADPYSQDAQARR
ncbi:hypothetical protein HK105_207385 [Polyrhizophydium stewartii]|uniref:G-protein coupled receptors family 2 profile 2 domain-containing protein n=1 Tax=Polyrhizophydium stewartii TaxID=2732419 RepID=A0ABR4MUY3_9FUNG